MYKTRRLFQSVIMLVGGSMLLTSCFLKGINYPTSEHPGQLSTATGNLYNDGIHYEVKPYEGQPDAPNMVFIEGGRHVMGSFEEDMMTRRDNIERTISVASFYMDETEIANIHWLEYLFHLQQDSTPVNPNIYLEALPDTTVWEGKLAFNDPYVAHYLRYPGFRFFPVVGVTWNQAAKYSDWRTAAVNLRLNEESGGASNWSGAGRVPLEEGIFIPDYRLPTEAEWEYAAQAMMGTQWLDENQTHQRLYPWDGHATRNPYGKEMGYFLANFKRGRGDYAGIAGKLNDGALITSYIYEFPPNDLGLYNMAGNVSEWVQDVYRPLSFQDFDDLNPIRRDGWIDPDGASTNGPAYNNKKNNPTGYTSLIDDRARVYKGGSWKDVAYWMSPGTRRYLDQDSATATIGFRCAMIRAGSNF